MNTIEKYEKILSELLKIDITFEYYITFGNLYPAEWRKLTINDIPRSKNNEGLLIRINKITQFKLVQLPGCCGICISTGVFVHNNYRNKGINSILNNMRIELAKYSGYGILLCTDKDNNDYERKTLNKNDWKDIYSFINPRTNNKLNITIKEL